MTVRFGAVRKQTMCGYYLPGRTDATVYAESREKCEELVRAGRERSEYRRKTWQGGEFRSFETETMAVYF